MAIPAKPTMTTPPTAPVRGEDRSSFATKANAYVVFIRTNVTDLTAAIDWQNTVFTATDDAGNAAIASAESASESLDQTIVTAALYTVRHQGAHATAPTTRNNGSALQAGDFYFNTSVLKTFTWDGE